MKQYILHAPSSPEAASDQAQQAISQGYRWLQVILPGNIGHDSEKEIAEAIATKCRECSTASSDSDGIEVIMTLVDKPSLVDELKISGLHLSDATAQIVAAAREQLGAHAILGADCVSPDQALALKPVDIDYITVKTGDSPEDHARFAKICDAVNGQGHRHHIVAQGNFTPEQEKELLAAGAAGFAIPGNE